ncbi:MAG: hypothetical protein WCI55_11440 [Armatimonadota bacterium]
MTIVPLVVGYFAIQWNRANFLGKSPEQIVAMGRQRWSDLYSKKYGHSDNDLSDAEEKYGFALKNLNDRAMTRLPKSRQVWLTEVRKTTWEYAVEAHQIGSLVSGGQSKWQTFNATIMPDVEETIADCIVAKPVTAIKLKSIELNLRELDKVISQFRNERPTSSLDYRKIAKHRTILASKHSALNDLLKLGQQDDSSRIQLYMHRKIEVARGDNFSV